MINLGRIVTISVVAAVLCACAGAGIGGASAALASVAEFGSEGEGAGQLGREPLGVAIDQESDDVYVTDRSNDRVSKFGREGEFLFAWGWGVADREERMETCANVCFAGFAGGGAGELHSPAGVAVNNEPLSPSDGDVYVEDAGNERIEEFEPDGIFVLMFGGEVNKTIVEARTSEEANKEPITATPEEEDVCTAASKDECQEGTSGAAPGEFELEEGGVVAVGSTGTVYVGDDNRVQEFSEDGVFEAEVELPGAGLTKAVAAGAGNDIYVESQSRPGVREYEACATSCTGKEVGTPRDLAGEPGPIALGPSGELFIRDGEGTGHHVLEYSQAGKELASFDTETEAPKAMAYGTTAKALYVSNPGMVRLVSPPPPGPLVIGETASGEGPTEARLEADVNPEGHAESSGEPLEYHFEYGETEALGKSTPVEASVGGSFEDRHLEATVTGLKPDVTYHFRVVATNAATESRDGAIQTVTTLPPALIESEWASHVTATSGELTAHVNPLGLATHYRFEYGRSTAYEEPSVPAPEAEIAAGEGSVTVSVLLEGLYPNTTYHYRIVAVNALGEAPGPDHTFGTQGPRAAELLDGRGWELVSPPNKRGVALELGGTEGGLVQAAENGKAITYFAFGPIDSDPSGNRSFAYSQFLSMHESSGGWATEDLATPQESIEGVTSSELSEYKMFSPNLSVGFVEPFGATPLSPPLSEAERGHQERTPYLRKGLNEREGPGEYVPLLTRESVASGVKFGGTQVAPGKGFEEATELVTASASASDVLVTSPMPLTGGFESFDNRSIFEVSPGLFEKKAVKLVSVLPDGVPAAQEGLVAAVGAGDRGVRNAISPEGTLVVFSTESIAGNHLYLRDTETEESVQLDAPAAGARNPGEGNAIYLDANDDDSKIFFVDEQRLTPGATATSGEPDLYMCEITSSGGKLGCQLKDLTTAVNAGERADVLGADIGTDEAGRYVYFVANGALTRDAKHGNCTGSEVGSLANPAESCNLYVEDAETGETRLIAVLSGRDAPDWQAGFEQRNDYSQLTSRVSPNGQYLAFMSQRSLTGYDNLDARTAEPDEEVFLYDRETATLRCVSCNPSGSRPVGVADPNTSMIPLLSPLLVDRPDVWGEHTLAGSIPGWPKIDDFHALYEPHNLFNDGRLFFDGPDELVPRATNGEEDVYEYEPDHQGSCELANGCVGLISSGSSSEESAFVDAGDEGEDVFFMTAAKLAPQDDDDALDIYDARVCTPAEPCPGPSTSVAPSCETSEACAQAPPAQPTIFGLPASASPSGPGNVQPSATSTSKAKPPTKAQLLAKALRACKRDRRKAARRACEAAARHRYDRKAAVKHTAKRRGK